MKLKKVVRTCAAFFLILVSLFLLLSLFGMCAHAAGLVDDTVNAANEYSKYPLENYQLDFFVDDSWDWLPWNWTDGIGKNIQYALYAITNFIWTVGLYISNATGYVVQEAYKLDFISDTANQIGKNIQTLAGITQNGFSRDGFYVGFLLIFVLVLGIYIAYTGLLKRETTKAVRAAINFIVVFILSASFIAYAPDYVQKVNEFSSDLSNAALSLGTKIVLPNSESHGKDGVDLIRDSLFAMQVKQPWLLLQYGTSDLESLGADRVESLLNSSPDKDERENIVKSEIEDRANKNLTINKTMSRMGTVVFLFLFNIGISIFIFLLTGMMIFSQVLFILFAMFLPISFLLSMIPTYEGMCKNALVKLFNLIMLRAGITLIITVAFSISSMFYSISAGYPFFIVAFLQIVTFAGIYLKLGDIMGMFSLQSTDSQQLGKRIFRKPYMLMGRRARHIERRIGRSIRSGAAAVSTGTKAGRQGTSPKEPKRGMKKTGRTRSRVANESGTNIGGRMGDKVGAVMDVKNRVRDKAGNIKEKMADMPLNTRYAIHSGVNRAKENVSAFKRGVTDGKESRQQTRDKKRQQRRMSVGERRRELEKANSKTAAGFYTDNRRYPGSGYDRYPGRTHHRGRFGITPKSLKETPHMRNAVVKRSGKNDSIKQGRTAQERIYRKTDNPTVRKIISRNQWKATQQSVSSYIAKDKKGVSGIQKKGRKK